MGGCWLLTNVVWEELVTVKCCVTVYCCGLSNVVWEVAGYWSWLLFIVVGGVDYCLMLCGRLLVTDKCCVGRVGYCQMMCVRGLLQSLTTSNWFEYERIFLSLS